MEDKEIKGKKRRRVAGIVATVSAVVVIFLCIFFLYHLPERDPVETPEVAVNADAVETPLQDFEETRDINSATPAEVSQMLGNLEMQYQNDRVNGEPYAAEQSGFRLAYAYYKAGDIQQAVTFTNSLMETYSYDSSFVAKCRELLKVMDSGNASKTQ